MPGALEDEAVEAVTQGIDGVVLNASAIHAEGALAEEEDEEEKALMTKDMRKLFLFGATLEDTDKSGNPIVQVYENGYFRSSPSPYYGHNNFFCIGETLDYPEDLFHQLFIGFLQSRKSFCSVWLRPDQTKIAKLFTSYGFAKKDEYMIMTAKLSPDATTTDGLENLEDHKKFGIPSSTGTKLICKKINAYSYFPYAAHTLKVPREHLEQFSADITTNLGIDHQHFFMAEYRPKGTSGATSTASCMIIAYPDEQVIALHFVARNTQDSKEDITGSLVRYALNQARIQKYTKVIVLAHDRDHSMYTKLGFTAGDVYTLYTSPHAVITH